MSGLRKFFHEIFNRLNIISTASFTLADSLERSGGNMSDSAAVKRINSRVVHDVKIIEEAYCTSGANLEELSRILSGEVALNDTVRDNADKGDTAFEKIGVLLVNIKSLKASVPDSLSSLIRELYLMEENCLLLAECLKNIKKELVSLDMYETEK